MWTVNFLEIKQSCNSALCDLLPSDQSVLCGANVNLWKMQVRRRQWKLQLLEELRSLTTADPVPLPTE